MQENILDLLSSTKKNGFVDHTRQHRILPVLTTTNASSKPLGAPSNVRHHNNGIFDGLDENMSKFFLNFHKKDLNSANTTTTAAGSGLGQPTPTTPQSDFPNGYNGIHHNNFYSGFGGPTERLLMLQQQQKQMEEQFLNLGLKQGE